MRDVDAAARVRASLGLPSGWDLPYDAHTDVAAGIGGAAAVKAITQMGAAARVSALLAHLSAFGSGVLASLAPPKELDDDTTPASLAVALDSEGLPPDDSTPSRCRKIMDLHLEALYSVALEAEISAAVPNNVLDAIAATVCRGLKFVGFAQYGFLDPRWAQYELAKVSYVLGRPVAYRINALAKGEITLADFEAETSDAAIAPPPPPPPEPEETTSEEAAVPPEQAGAPGAPPPLPGALSRRKCALVALMGRLRG